MTTWEQRVHALVMAQLEEKRRPGSTQAIINTALGELWEQEIEEIDTSVVLGCCAEYKLGEYPDGIKMLTAFVDVGETRLHYVVRGWNEDFTSWMVDRGVVQGIVDKPDTWDTIKKIILSNYGGLKISLCGVDAGYRPDLVYRFQREMKHLVLPTRGSTSQISAWQIKTADAVIDGRKVHRASHVATFNPNVGKSWIFNHMRIEKDSPGAWYLPKDIDDDYCQQMVSEHMIITSSGEKKFVRHAKENHFFDCEVGAYKIAEFIESRIKAATRKPKEKDKSEAENKTVEANQKREYVPPLPTQRMRRTSHIGRAYVK